MNQEPFFVVAVLTVIPGAAGIFHDFETRAARILARYGGTIERTVTVDRPATEEQQEIHVLRFPSRDAFARYRADEELASLAPLRAACIARTDIWTGHAGPEYPQYRR